ncbi:HD domain-containing protein [Herbivorax sp. ANBcel31]|uniref:Ppx/GppA phosphatase family protein n=1 Tax=Herbivorax sp. ANBcel31 TaxID=3069754 RepID=UPI0027B49DB1|nr:HD domain-containing protein [Herbivorax sp. ANBcel31]MDQ2086854.1 HD domain-containing protein [Herbivorax sp. ANBcel31]
MEKEKYEVMAAIDVGSNSLRMMIAQVTSEGEIIPLEDLYMPTHIGKDTFSYGRIQVESIHDTCDTLKGFLKIIKDYKLKNYRAVSTSGIREAENREYVLEQIKNRTGLEVEVINNAQERFLMSKAIRSYMANEKKFTDKGILIIDIRSGGVEISVYSEGSLRFTEYMKVGSLRLREILASLEKRTLDFPGLMEEFIESRIDFMKLILPKFDIKSFVGLGGELKTIIKLCTKKKNNKFQIKKEDLKKLYEKVHRLTTSQIIEEFSLSKNQAEILLPSIILFNSFLEMTNANSIFAPMVSLRHGLLVHMVDDRFNTARKKEAYDDIITSVWHIGKKYSIDEVHSRFIEKIALSIFDQSKKIHVLGETERFYLRVASILHDIGKYVNHNNHDVHSYNIIRFQDIMGLSDSELNIVANIARYHSDEIPNLSHDNYYVLDAGEKIIVSKLAVILRIAEALDISHKQKIKKLEINNYSKELHFNVWADQNIMLEKWTFASNVNFFEEVMGSKPVIRCRG